MMEAVTLASESLVLDAPSAADIDDIERYCQDPIFERFLTVPWPYRRSDAVFFVDEFVPKGWSSGEEVTWAIRQEGGSPLLGVVGFRIPTANLGFWLGAEHRGSGVMPAAVGLVADWVFAGGRERMHWECVVGNAASASVARKSGFTFDGIGPATVVGRDGAYPQSWHGTLTGTDDRAPKPGWPA